MANELLQAAVIVGICVVILSLLMGAGYLIKVIFLPVKTLTSQIDSAGNIIDKTYDADNAIYNYEWFKTQYEKIQANQAQVNISQKAIEDFRETYGDPQSWDFFTKQEYSRLSAVKQGLQNQDANLVAEYNARSKMANREIFKDKLPLYVDKMLW